jgi:hypothetical protein
MYSLQWQQVVDDPPFGKRVQFGSAFHVELNFNVVPMRLYRLHTHAELLRDLTDTEACADKLKDLKLTI